LLEDTFGNDFAQNQKQRCIDQQGIELTAGTEITDQEHGADGSQCNGKNIGANQGGSQQYIGCLKQFEYQLRTLVALIGLVMQLQLV